MTVCGSLLGPNLDNYHSAFGVLHYSNPITLSIPNTPCPILTTAPWVPPLFGFAGFIISTLYYIADDVYNDVYGDIYSNTNSNNNKTSKPTPTWPLILTTISAFSFQYYLSGLMSSVPFSSPFITFVMSTSAALGYILFDGTTPGLIVSAATSISGPAIEYAIISLTGQYEYADKSVLGLDSTCLFSGRHGCR